MWDVPQDDPPSFPLPVDALVLVLQHLDLQQRLGPCSLVSHTWHAAAIAATSSLKKTVHPFSLDDLQQNFAAWLQKHASVVQHIHLEHYVAGRALQLQLPIPQLQCLRSLDLIGINLQLGPTDAASAATCSSHASAAPCSSSTSTSSPWPFAVQHVQSSGDNSSAANPFVYLTSLTRLSLENVIGVLQRLPVLTALQQLQLKNIRSSMRETQQELGEAFAVCCQQLQQLTCLELHSAHLDDDGLSAVSCLQQLQQLRVLCCYSRTASFCAQLPISLTLLEVHAYGAVLTSSSTPGLFQLTGLKHLVLHSMDEFDPAGLSKLLQLTHLQLRYSRPASVAALLGVLPKLQLLHHLELDFGLRAAPIEVDLAQCTALVSSSNLTHLLLENIKLPEGAMQYMFAANRQQLFSSLRVLRLCCLGDSSATKVLSDPAHVCYMSLVQLTQLQELQVHGSAVDDSFAEHVLAKLTWLRSLEIRDAVCFTDLGLCYLTGLSALHTLCVKNCALSSDVTLKRDIFYKGETLSGAPGFPLQQQLRTLCSSSKACLQWMLQQKDQQLADALQELAATQEQLAACKGAQERVAVLEQQLAEAQAQLALAKLDLPTQ